MNHDDVMTLEEVAAYLKVHPSTMYRLIKARKLPHFKINRHHRFLRASIDEWMAQRMQQESTPVAAARLRAV